MTDFSTAPARCRACAGLKFHVATPSRNYRWRCVTYHRDAERVRECDYFVDKFQVRRAEEQAFQSRRARENAIWAQSRATGEHLCSHCGHPQVEFAEAYKGQVAKDWVCSNPACHEYLTRGLHSNYARLQERDPF